MDTLALLCNLHADGPATLQRLRREGCESLESLLSLELSSLSVCLDWNEELSQRFQREAVLLAERLGEPLEWEIVEVEDDESNAELVPHTTPSEGHAPDIGEFQDELVESAFEEEHEVDSPEERDFVDEPDFVQEARESDSVQKVLGTWRDLDQTEPPLAPDESSAELEHSAAAADPQLRDYVVEPGPSTPNRPLARVELRGLDQRLVQRLAQLGIHSLGGLAEVPTTALARRLPMPFTRVRRLQHIARGELSRGLSHQNAGGNPSETPTEASLETSPETPAEGPRGNTGGRGEAAPAISPSRSFPSAGPFA